MDESTRVNQLQRTKKRIFMQFTGLVYFESITWFKSYSLIMMNKNNPNILIINNIDCEGGMLDERIVMAIIVFFTFLIYIEIRARNFKSENAV